MIPSSAAGAYSAAAQLANQAQPAANPLADAGGGSDFGAMLKNVATSFTAQGRTVETGAVQMAEGKADVVNLVTAVAETEVALEAIVAVRDKVIAAYEEIMRMPI